MTTVVAIMDEPGLAARTDVIVLVEPERERLLWVPRDLWCEQHRERINGAFKRGGAEALRAALGEHGLGADHVVCLGRDATESALEGAQVQVFVPRRLELLYPLPGMTVPEGSRRVTFEPPAEVLSGARVHEWIGARFDAEGAGSDLERIERQKIFLVALLEAGFDFRRALGKGVAHSISSPEAVRELSRVRAGWSLETLDGLVPAEIEGELVLVRAEK
jgi:hypothetical protein